MRRLRPISFFLAVLLVPLGGCGETAPPPRPPAPHELAFREHVQPILGDYCLGCHGGEEPEGDLSFERYVDGDEVPSFEALRGATADFERLAHHVMNGSMPPAGEAAPSKEQRDQLVGWFEDTIAAAWREAPPNPGRVTMRRLNRVEYRNTVRDLVGVDYDTSKRFPTDDVGYGFDHIGDVLSMPPILLEKYLDAAEAIAAQAIPVEAYLRRFEAEAGSVSGNNRAAGDVVALNSQGRVDQRVVFPRTGTYILRARVMAQQAGPPQDWARVTFHLGDRLLASLAVEEETGVETERLIRVVVGAGTRRVGLGFPNDYWQPKHPDPKLRGDRNLRIDWLEVEGPLDDDKLGPPPKTVQGLITCAPEPGEERACAESILGPLLKRAFRRPSTPAELQRYVALVFEAMAAGETFAGGIQMALQAILVAPQFLFRVELDERSGAAQRPLSDHELASRLSYFLWSSCPDETLMAAADAGTLRSTLHEQVTRMLADSRARTLVTNFAAQWLELRRLEAATPDPRRYKNFDEKLRSAMRTETELFVEAIIREDRSIRDLIDAPFTFLNERLAKHYGIAGVQGEKFRRVDLPDGTRGGVLGHASILTLTSYPHRTSPVLRGKWVMEELLGTPPPPPPPGVGTLEGQSPEMLKLSVRERLAAHRADPTCAVCHDAMDNLGYGLENFDAIGAWRRKDGMEVLDASGVLPGGRTFSGPAELRRILREDPGFPRCFAEKLLTYALGRGLEPYDRPAVQQIVREAQQRRLRVSAFVHAIVATDAFTMRRSSGDSP